MSSRSPDDFIPQSENDPFPVAFSSQFPAPGTEVTSDSQIIVNVHLQTP